MSAGLVAKIKSLSAHIETSREESRDLRSKVDSLEEMVKDLMANFEMKQQLHSIDGADGGDIIVANKRGGANRR